MKYCRYETLNELGRGSMGVVYEAYDPQIDRTLALKVLRPDFCANEPSVRRFLKEAQTIGRLSHPQIVTVYDAGEDQGALFIAMELLEGRPLNELISEKNFTPDEILDLGVQIAETLDYAHGKGVVHRDIKPSNILVQPDGRIKITDFGIAHIEDPACTLQTREGEILGTPAYMSPEQVQGRPVDGRSDLFSLGVILYQLTTGMRPFGHQGTTLAALFYAIAHASPDPMDLNGAVDPKLSRVIMRCLGKDPVQRYPTGAALADALRECRSKEHVGPVRLLINAVERQASSLRFPHVFLLVAVTLAAGLFYLFPQNPLESSVPLGGHRVSANPDGPDLVSSEMAMDRTQRGRPVGAQLQPPAKAADSPLHSGPPGAVLQAVEVSDGRISAGAQQTELLRTAQLSGPRQQELSRQTRLHGDGEPSPAARWSPLEIQGILEISSSPAGAEVMVDGVLSGVTPFVSRIPPGDHVVVLKASEHNDWEQRVTIEAGKEYPFSAVLQPMEQAILAVESDPPRARILVNGVQRGKTPTKLKLPPGDHTVKIQHRRYKDYQTRVNLARAGEQSLKATLTPVQSKPRRIASPEPPPRPIPSLVSQARYHLSPQTLWRRVRNLF